MDDREAKQGERQRLMGKRKLNRDEREERRNAEPDLQQSDGGKDHSAARKRRAGRDTQRGDRLNKREGDDRIGDHAVIELRRRRIAEDRFERAWPERLSRNKARSHQRPSVVDKTGSQASDEGAKAELAKDERREDPG